jgi:hypothetical protein
MYQRFYYISRLAYAYDGKIRLDLVCNVGCRGHLDLDPHEFTGAVEDPVGIRGTQGT